jgi:hypothetical protein
MVANARVVVMGRAEGIAHTGLAELLGDDRATALERVLRGRAEGWAAGVGQVHVHVAGPDGPRGLRDAVGGLFASGDEPVLVVWPELASWRAEHAEAALGDLGDGCAVSFGAMFDGGFYLVAFAQPVAALLELDDDAWISSDPIALAAEIARDSGLAIGLLRTERGLRGAADVGALLADPLLDDELRALLS